MYLGVATFHQERMNEFLTIAKNLEIKEVSKNIISNDENLATIEPNISDNEKYTKLDTKANKNPTNSEEVSKNIEIEIDDENAEPDISYNEKDKTKTDLQLQNSTEGMFD